MIVGLSLVIWGSLCVGAHAGAILREVYEGISGSSVADLTNAAAYPDNPSSTNYIYDLFEVPINRGDNYGQRLRGYIVPPESGYYTFWISSDDASELWLSTNESPSNLVRIARVDTWTWPREWGKESNQQSSPIYLHKGRLYAVRALMKEGSGCDCLAVRWQLPNGEMEEPLEASHLLPPGGPFAAPCIVTQAGDSAVVEGAAAEFFVSVSNMYPVGHQWQRDGTNISGAVSSNYTLSCVALGDDGAVFRCVLTNALGTVTGAEYTLSVTADTNAPELAAVYNVGTDQVYVIYSEAVESNSALAVSNYGLDGGVSVTSAEYGADASTVVLGVRGLQLEQVYVLWVSNVSDRAAASNVIASGTQWTFTSREFAPQDIGSPPVAGTLSYTTNGVDMTAAGDGIGDTEDQFFFNYREETGDFDIEVRVESLERADPWTAAGIMARESLVSSSRFAAVLGTPSVAGIYFEYRGSGANLLLNANFDEGNGGGQYPLHWDASWGEAYAETNGQVNPGGKPAPSSAQSGEWMVLVNNNRNTTGDNWNGAAQTLDVTPGQAYVLSAYYLIQSNLPAGHGTLLKFDWYDSGWTWLGQVEGPRLSNACTWTYTAITGMAPAGAAHAKAIMMYEDKDGRTNSPGEQFNVFWDTAAVCGGAGAGTVRTGSYPVNYPYTWLRLKRVGDLFSGYASMDGERWTLLGSQNLPMPTTVYLGMALGSHATDVTATVEFRGWDSVSGGTTGGLEAVDFEPPGPCSRRTALVISEIMYHPRQRADGRDLEFIELFNSGPLDCDLSGYRLSGEVSYDFPAGTIIPAGGFLVVANNPADVAAVYGLSGVLGGYGGRLSDEGGTLRLRNARDAILLEVKYDDVSPWPAAADGAGHSLVLRRPSYGEGDPRAWDASTFAGGSPGSWDPVRKTAWAGVVINEYLAHTDLPQVDFIELYNHSTGAVDLSNCTLSDDPSTDKYTICTGTVLSAGGFLSYDQNQLGFSLSMHGDMIILRDPDGDVVDAVKFGPVANGVSSGRRPDGGPEFHELVSCTAGTNNSAALTRDVVINEIMYHPISDAGVDEYVELYNRGTAAVDVSAWRFVDGIDFTFPSNTVIPAGGYLVVAADASNLIARYAQLSATNTIGDWSGSLADGGERLALAMPDDPALPGQDLRVVDEVTYGDGERWGGWADGGGSSLELKDAHADNDLADNWAASDETSKAPWTTVAVTGRLDNGTGSADEIHILLLREGECLVDDVDVHRLGGANRVTNGTFETGLDGWTIQGNHVRSHIESGEGYGSSSQSLHVVASGGGDTGANRIESTLNWALPVGSNAVISAHVRWLCGHTDILFRINGNYLEAVGHLDGPASPGTPGQANSRTVANTGPALEDVGHSPVLPGADEEVVVRARAADPDGITAVRLKYRIDPATAYTTVTMHDDGTSGDDIGGDGIYAATMPGRAAGTMVAFYIEAVDGASPAATNIFPAEAPEKECLVRFGSETLPGSFGIYRLWLTHTNTEVWTRREQLSNEPIEATFVYGGVRAIYNAAAHYHGSPWIRPVFDSPTGNVCAYTVTLPEEEPFLGSGKLDLDTLEPARDNTCQRERISYWMAGQVGLAFSHQRYIHVYCNGLRRGTIYADSQHVSADYLRCWIPGDARGEYFKVDDWFEFSGDTFINWTYHDATLERFTTTGGVLKKARYRWSWEKKSNKGLNDDYDDLFDLVEVMNETNAASYAEHVSGWVDAEEWMKIFALRHSLCDWDGYGYSRGKNMYAYKPRKGRWMLLLWDLDFGLGAHSHEPTASLFMEINDPVLSNRFFEAPAFRRSFWQSAKAIAEGPMLCSAVDPRLDAYYQALTQNGVSCYRPSAVKEWIAHRRNYILEAAADLDVAFAVTSNGGADFSTNRNSVIIEGTAPLSVYGITVNGEPHPVSWSTVTNWMIRVVLAPGTNDLDIVGVDENGDPVSGASDGLAVEYTGSGSSAAGNVVFNELMYNPPPDGAQFVEFYNRSTNCAFDLYGLRIEGLGYTFTNAVVVTNRGYLVLAGNEAVFHAAYGTDVPVAGVFGGNLDNGGEMLSLESLDGTNVAEVIDVVYYDDQSPWPQEADGGGCSLQLVDVDEDNDRVGNWAVDTNTLYTPGRANSVTDDLPQFPATWINEVQSSNAATLADSDGDYDPWLELYNAGTSSLSLAGYYLSDDYSNLVKWTFPAGAALTAGQFRIAWADAETDENSTSEWHAGFRLCATGGCLALVHSNAGRLIICDYMNYPAVAVDRSYGSYPDGDPHSRQYFHFATPGGTNNAASAPYPLFINEWMAINDSTVTDEFGECDDWFEIYNSGTSAVDISGFHLSDDLSEADKWTIPTGTVVQAGEFMLVWADNDTEQNGPTNELHAGFKLDGDGEAIGLYTPDLTMVDAVTFGTQSEDVSQGRWPDGQAEPFYFMDLATPRAANVVSTNNTPPDLEPVGPRTVDEGVLLLVTNHASDADSPTQTLTFSFGAGAPAGAALDTNSGVFSWTPTEEQGPCVTAIVMTVTDNGYPPKSDSIAMTVTVEEVNSAPLIFAPADQSVYPGSRITLGISATDTDIPADNLSFSLEPGAPAGAEVGASNGLFSWEPSSAQAGSTNQIGVRVTDDGSPSLWSTCSFVLTVTASDEVFDATGDYQTETDGCFVVNWSSHSGSTYRVQCCNGLQNPAWTALVGDVTATGDVARKKDPTSPQVERRFYRILELR